MTDATLTPQAKTLLEQSIISVLGAKGITMSICQKTASEIVEAFNLSICRYIEELQTENHLAIVREALQQIH